jgi:activator of 2-hydroxyglutaryl-CoA dehydratase
LAAKLINADVIHNEITAQMVSSVLFAPETDTIFEIGGQDSKYISVRNGSLADFEMNKICAGGTGSFLEEQAERLGIRIFGEFAELALQGSNPCYLGDPLAAVRNIEWHDRAP